MIMQISATDADTACPFVLQVYDISTSVSFYTWVKFGKRGLPIQALYGQASLPMLTTPWILKFTGHLASENGHEHKQRSVGMMWDKDTGYQGFYCLLFHEFDSLTPPGS